MGLAMQLVSGFVTNPGATITAVAVNSGESLTVPYFAAPSRAWLGTVWSPGVTAGVARIRSPRFHDVAQGLRLQRGATVFESLLPLPALQPIYPADALTVEVSGGGAETDMIAYLQYFEDLPGVAARLAGWNDIAPRIKNLLGVEVDLVSGTVGAYGTPRALNFSFDTLKANTDYAILGYTCSVKCGVICLFGPDFGNQHIGGPGLLSPVVDTRHWFNELSYQTGRPCIPIINANNRGTTFLQAADVAAALAVNVTLNMAELG